MGFRHGPPCGDVEHEAGSHVGSAPAGDERVGPVQHGCALPASRQDRAERRGEDVRGHCVYAEHVRSKVLAQLARQQLRFLDRWRNSTSRRSRSGSRSANADRAWLRLFRHKNAEGFDLGLSTLGTDDEASGVPNPPEQIAAARKLERARPPQPAEQSAMLPTPSYSAVWTVVGASAAVVITATLAAIAGR